MAECAAASDVVSSAGAVAGAVFAVESGIYLLHERDYYEALGNTVYPGERRERGGGETVGKLLSSLFAFDLAGTRGNSLAASNLGEGAPDEDTLVCGDAAAAKELALELAGSLISGRALDAGPLASARSLE